MRSTPPFSPRPRPHTAAGLLVLLLGAAPVGGARAQAAARAGTEVDAPPGPTWDALTAVLAAERVALRAGDRGTGFVLTNVVTLGPVRQGRRPSGRADCGGDPVAGLYAWPARATLEATVRPGARAGSSVVLVVARYTGGTPVRACRSRGLWEEDLEFATKARAESPAH